MKTLKKLAFKGKIAANLSNFSYETPWASAYAEFMDNALGEKLSNCTSLLVYGFELEAMELSDNEEDSLWEKRLAAFGLTHDDLDLNKDEFWSIICDDGTTDKVRAIRYTNGVLEWCA